MTTSAVTLRRTALAATVGLLALSFLHPGTVRAGSLKSREGEFDVDKQEISFAGRTVHATYVKPLAPRHPGVLVAFFTGDAGWLGASGLVFEHLAEQGYELAGYNSREALRAIEVEEKSLNPSAAADAITSVFAQAKKDLGLPETTPLLVVGDSRGASAVAFSAVHPKLQEGLSGAIAIALTRESDYLRAPDPAKRRPEIQVDDQERIQLYPALALIGSVPLAVIQSTGDKYVPSAEARKLFGPDTPTRRLYEVEAKNHGFSGGEDALLKDLDDALQWIASWSPKGGATQ